MLINNFSYTHIFIIFLFQKDFCFSHDNTDACFLLLFQKDFYICLGSSFAFSVSLLQKDFDTFHVFPFQAFICFFNLIHLYKKKLRVINRFYMYTRKKNYKKCFLQASKCDLCMLHGSLDFFN